MTSNSEWNSPDPRVKWALDAFDNEGIEPNSMFGYYAPIATWTLLAASVHPFTNFLRKRPLYTGLPITILATGLGLFSGLKFREYLSNRRAEEIAMVKGRNIWNLNFFYVLLF
jgi:hypothetical protein